MESVPREPKRAFWDSLEYCPERDRRRNDHSPVTSIMNMTRSSL